MVFWGFLTQNLPILVSTMAWRGLREGEEGCGGSEKEGGDGGRSKQGAKGVKE